MAKRKAHDSPPDFDYPAPLPNASVWPVQLRHLDPVSSSFQSQPLALTHVPVQELNFEDVSFFCNFDSIAALLLGPSSPPITKRPKLDHQQHEHNNSHTTIIDTHCIFKILPRSDQDRQLVQSLIASQTQTQHSAQVALSCSSVSHQASIFGHQASLLHPPTPTGQALLQFPLLQSDRFAPQLRPDKFTNAEWIAAAATLADLGLVQLQSSLSLADPTRLVPKPQFIPTEHLFLQLSISVSVPVSHSASIQPAQSARLIQLWGQLVRFADAKATEHDEQLRRNQPDANFVYQHLHPATIPATNGIQHPQLNPALLPFQRRSTAFILGREGKTVSDNGQLSALSQPGILASNGISNLGLWWKQIRDHLYFSFRECRFVNSPELTHSSNLSGSMLSEEMGLGKTVEVISLILLNPPDSTHLERSWYDEINDIQVNATKTTLIVAPEILRQQWVDELQLHAPHLKVYSFLSRAKTEKDVPKNTDIVDWAKRFDVIVVSYNVLSSEVHAAHKEPKRSRRQQRKYERPRSPLLRFHFHRVVMDEVQLVGKARAAEVASMISRQSSLAVSGTPVQKIDNLVSCFHFLRVPGFQVQGSELRVLLSSLFAPALVSTLRTLCMRHTKAAVAHEMDLPPQTRSIVPIEFTAIEAAFYADVWRDALDAMGLNEKGQPTSSDWQPNLAEMRNQLLLLRQACTHPQVAVQFRGGMVGNHALRSLDDVLALMIDGTRSDLATARLGLYDRRILKAILTLYYRQESRHLVVEAQLQDLYRELRGDAESLEADITAARRDGPLYEFTDKELQLEDNEKARRSAAAGREGFDEPDLELDGDDEAALAGPSSASASEWQQLCADQGYLERRYHRRKHTFSLRQRLRSLILRVHQVEQFLGNLYFQRGEFVQQRIDARNPPASNAIAVGSDDGLLPASKPEATGVKIEEDGNDPSSADSTAATKVKAEDPKPDPEAALKDELKRKEDEAYSAAERTRQRLLTEARKDVEQAVRKLKLRSPVDFGLSEVLCETELFESGGGLSTSDAYASLAEACSLLDSHAEVLFSWRSRIVERLSRPVNRDINLEKDDDDQYQENLDTQAEAETLLEMYRPLLAEREKILTGSVALGATAKPQLYVQLEAAHKNARRRRLLLGDGGAGEEEDETARVQRQQLEHFNTLEEERRKVSLDDSQVSRSVQGLQTVLKDMLDRSVRDEEEYLARQALGAARAMSAKQTRLLNKLRAEERTLLAPLFNARSQYFKEIQALSDSVADPVFSVLDDRLAWVAREEAGLVVRVEALVRRQRYLSHLGLGRERQGSPERCYICTEPISTGVLTGCGHLTCEACFAAWQARGYRTCPMCKAHVKPSEVHRITSHASAAAISRDSHGDACSGAGFRYRVAAASTIPAATLATRFGSKLDLVVRHVLSLSRAGHKSIVFSSFGRGLDLLATSLTGAGVRFVRSTGRGSIAAFQADVPVLLLHSGSQSSGLNLVCATHVHVLEPMGPGETGRERQALGRVHRIGQTRHTYVWSYCVTGTVEERVRDLVARYGESLYTEAHAEAHADPAPPPVPVPVPRLSELEELCACFFPPAAAAADPPAPTPAPTPSADDERAKRVAAIERRLALPPPA